MTPGSLPPRNLSIRESFGHDPGVVPGVTRRILAAHVDRRHNLPARRQPRDSVVKAPVAFAC
jgi:hypothetical protein